MIFWMSAIVKVALVFLFHICECFLFLLFWIASGYFPVQAHGSLHKWSPRENSYKWKNSKFSWVWKSKRQWQKWNVTNLTCPARSEQERKSQTLWCENGQLDRQNKSKWETSLLVFKTSTKMKSIVGHLEVHSFWLLVQDVESRETIAYITNHSLATETWSLLLLLPFSKSATLSGTYRFTS